jgi:hypothetical protein
MRTSFSPVVLASTDLGGKIHRMPIEATRATFSCDDAFRAFAAARPEADGPGRGGRR